MGHEALDGIEAILDLAEAHLRAIEPAIAMGFAGRAEARSASANRDAIIAQMSGAAATGSIPSVIKGVRQASQILIIALAAYLAIEGSVSMGAIIASSILFSKALSPIDQVVGSWRSVFQTRGAWLRLADAGTRFAEHPFLIMKDKAFVELARLRAPLP